MDAVRAINAFEVDRLLRDHKRCQLNKLLETGAHNLRVEHPRKPSTYPRQAVFVIRVVAIGGQGRRSSLAHVKGGCSASEDA